MTDKNRISTTLRLKNSLNKLQYHRCIALIGAPWKPYCTILFTSIRYSPGWTICPVAVS